MAYDFPLDAHSFRVAIGGTHVRYLDFHTDPAARDNIDPELGEVRRPELAGNVHLHWHWRDVGIDWHSQYLGEMLLSFLEIETARTLYSDAVFMHAIWLHNLNISYTASKAHIAPRRHPQRNRRTTVPHRPRIPVVPRARMLYLCALYRVR